MGFRRKVDQCSGLVLFQQRRHQSRIVNITPHKMVFALPFHESQRLGLQCINVRIKIDDRSRGMGQHPANKSTANETTATCDKQAII